jgi:glycosyltransferase involved in cell wall biosynthesis
MTVGVIISTYNNPQWLEKTLWGYSCQTCRDFELLIADDGSGEETRLLVEQMRHNFFPHIKHVWHEDRGFQKCAILNLALKEAQAEYLIFTDQDVVPRADFVASHLRLAKKGYFLSGGYVRLSMPVSQIISKDDIVEQRAFQLSWLHQNGLRRTFRNTKLFHSPLYAGLMNSITPAKATWNGCNSSGWKKDFIAINGFNEEMQYGGEDREFGERLFNMGIKSRQIRYSAVGLHLDHKRPYKNEAQIAKNNAIRRQVKQNREIRTAYGIEKT